MTGNRTHVANTFLLVLVLFAATTLAYFYVAQENASDVAEVEVEPQKKSALVAWEHLRNLKDGAKVEVRAHAARVIAEVARSDARRQQGLSGREGLAENEGMLFIFDQQEPYSFWNKDMKFPIDVLWMARDTVTGVSPLPRYDGKAPAVITAPLPVDVVLEVPAGFANKHTIVVGSSIKVYEVQ